MEMLQQPDQITFLYINPIIEFRQVRMNVPHPAQVTPSWYGDSVGHYEGDMLVIDTVGVRTERPFAMLDRVRHAVHPGLHVVERYRLIDYEAAKGGVGTGRQGESSAPRWISTATTAASTSSSLHGRR